jgi:hypothetical protein
MTMHNFYSNNTNVACAVARNVNTLRVQLIFPSKPNISNLFEFPTTKSTQKSNIGFKNDEINYIKSNSSNVFQEH